MYSLILTIMLYGYKVAGGVNIAIDPGYPSSEACIAAGKQWKASIQLPSENSLVTFTCTKKSSI